MSDTPAILGGPPLRPQGYRRWPRPEARERELLLEALDSGNWDQRYGRFVREFEERFGAFQGAAHVICVSNGEAALRVPLQALGLPQGGEVILPAYTFVASATAVIQAGLVPVFVDVDPGSFCLSPEAVEDAIGDRTVAIMPVHLAGMPAHMDDLVDLADADGLALVEDAAQAWGSRWRGRGVGTLGSAGGFSFHASKNLTCGEGGAVTTSTPELAERCASIANNGRGASGERYRHVRMGGNSRLTDLQGALLCAGLERYPSEHEARERAATGLRAALGELAGVTVQDRAEQVDSCSWHLLLFRIDPEAFGGLGKATICRALAAEGIPATVGYETPVQEQPMFASGSGLSWRALDCPVAHRACEREAIWVRHTALLDGDEAALDVARALERVQRHAGALRELND